METPQAHVGIGQKGKTCPHGDYIMREGKYAEYAERLYLAMISESEGDA